MSDQPALPQTEGIDPRLEELDAWPVFASAEALLEGQMAAVAALRPALAAITGAVEAAAERLAQSAEGRIIYCGAGTSGRLGVLDGSELGPTFDWPKARLHFLMAGGMRAVTEAVENAEDDSAQAEADVAQAGIGPQDVVIAVAASGATPYALAALRAAGARGALTIGIANSSPAPLLAAAICPILIATGAEPIAGSTRMKAGTAQKIALNMISTLIMVRLGRVWRGRMVDMVARNAKLRSRALRMVRELTGAEAAEAAAALERAGGKTKIAILLLSGMGLEEAQARLVAAGGHLRRVLNPRLPS